MAIDESPSSDDSQSFLGKEDDSKRQSHLRTRPTNATNAIVHDQRPTWRQRSHRFWLWEASSSALSIVLFVGIIVLLSQHDGKEYATVNDFKESTMKRPILYTYLSLMSAFMRAAMLLPVATAISQLTWSWFQKHRRLIDIERFDEASRGMIGSFELLWTVKVKHWVAIGAALTILALPVDAFIQNSVMIPIRKQQNSRPYNDIGTWVTNTKTMPKAAYYDDSQVWDSSTLMYATTPMIDAILLGITFWYTQNAIIRGEIPVTCPSGYCDFGTYQTLGVSANCTDRSDTVVSSNGLLTLPGADGLQLRDDSEDYFIAVKSYNTSNKNYAEETIGPLIARTSMIINMWDNEKPLGSECSLYWAVQTMNATADETTFHTLVETPTEDYPETRYETGDTVGEADLAYKMWPAKGCWYNNQTVSEKEQPDVYNQQCVHRVGKDAHIGLQRFILEDQDGFHGISELVSRNSTTNDTTWTRTNTFINNLYETQSDSRRPFYLDIAYNSIAKFMSRSVRRHGGVLNETNNLVDGEVTGYIYEMVFYYKIAWERLIFPAIIIVGSAVFVLCTALTTKNDLQWRRSNIPMLFHGLSERERDMCRYEPDLLKMEHAVTGMRVKLVDGAEGVRLTGYREEQDSDGLHARPRSYVA